MLTGSGRAEGDELIVMDPAEAGKADVQGRAGYDVLAGRSRVVVDLLIGPGPGR